MSEDAINQNQMNRIQQAFPELVIDSVERNSDGMVNEIVILNASRVLRFPKEDWAKKVLADEIRVLELVRQHTSLPVPHYDYVAEDMASYTFLKGSALYNYELSAMPETVQDKLMAQLGRFLYQLHSIPLEKAKAANIVQPELKDWQKRYEQIKETLFPLMFKGTQRWMEYIFAPVLENPAFLAFEPALIHDDLAQYHILYEGESLTGVIDFGTAHINDPAKDIGLLLVAYGETVIRKMQATYPNLNGLLNRARFYAAALELEWVYNGVKSGDNGWFTAHLDTARDRKAYHQGVSFG